MLTKSHLCYYTLFGLGVILSKWWYISATNLDLGLLLEPVVSLIEIVTGCRQFLDSSEGYFQQEFNIIINKSCSGFNLLLITILVFAHQFLQNSKSTGQQILAAFSAIFIGYFLTILMNSTRILSSLYISRVPVSFPQTVQDFIHESLGIFTNLTLLILAYLLTELLISKLRYHA